MIFGPDFIYIVWLLGLVAAVVGGLGVALIAFGLILLIGWLVTDAK